MAAEFTVVGPEWPEIPNVFAFTVGAKDTEGNAVSFSGDGVDAAEARAKLESVITPTSPIFWFEKQVHGNSVVLVPEKSTVKEGDGVVTFTRDTACVVRTADCIPVVFASVRGNRVGVAHAGWRGLRAGIIEAVFEKLDVPSEEVMVWLGPAIGQVSYEVGEDVYEAFSDYKGEDAFLERGEGKYLLDCYQVARNILDRLDIPPDQVSGGSYDTFADPQFHSARRDGEKSGRMVTAVWFS